MKFLQKGREKRAGLLLIFEKLGAWRRFLGRSFTASQSAIRHHKAPQDAIFEFVLFFSYICMVFLRGGAVGCWREGKQRVL